MMVEVCYLEYEPDEEKCFRHEGKYGDIDMSDCVRVVKKFPYDSCTYTELIFPNGVKLWIFK